MPSLNFEKERRNFREYYDRHLKQFEDAKTTFIDLIESVIRQANIGEVTKVEGRVKDKEECIKKFHRKYQSKLETDEKSYRIKDYITDLIGIRVVCLYEDQIAHVSEVLQQQFRTIDVTDKISAVEGTYDSFGYKGLHMDLALSDDQLVLPMNKPYAKLSFEVQIRSLIQDAWSVLDHKIKYKKSIPNDLRRRINVLSALFELADREFKEIRNATAELIQQATVAPIDDLPVEEGIVDEAAASEKRINAFNFLRVAGHFFRDFEFEDYKVDGFVQDILKLDPDFEKADLHKSLIENLKTVREYSDDFLAKDSDNTFSPYSSIRYCLYLSDRKTFQKILSRRARERFDEWLATAE